MITESIPTVFGNDLGQSSQPCQPCQLAVIGIGNSLVGDDGVGPAVIEELRRRLGDYPAVHFDILDGDMLAVGDCLTVAPAFIFIDAVAGESPGQLIFGGVTARAFAPSLHQLDIAVVMETLRWLKIVEPFPEWQVWGVTVRPPTELGPGLSPEVSVAADRLVEALLLHIDEVVGDV